MAVKIRFARLGCENCPFYRIVAADDKSRRDGKQVEVLGFYDPLKGKDDDRRVSLKFDRVEYRLTVGAQPTEPVERILFRAVSGYMFGAQSKCIIFHGRVASLEGYGYHQSEKLTVGCRPA